MKEIKNAWTKKKVKKQEKTKRGKSIKKDEKVKRQKREKEREEKGTFRKKKFIHDQFFRKVYGKEACALDLFSLLLTKEEFQFFNWKTLRAELSTYFDENWKERRADLVFSVQITNQEKLLVDKESRVNQKPLLSRDKERAKFLFLFEHKSYRDMNVLFQLLSYQNSIYQKGQKEDLVYPIIPVVFYHGKRDWKISKSFRDFILQRSSLKRYEGFYENILNFRYRLINLKAYNIEKLPDQLTTKTILAIMQKLGTSPETIDFDFLEHAFSLSDHLTSEVKKERIEAAARYIEQVVPYISVKVFQDLREKNLKVGERVMRAYKSGFQMAKEEGREEGLKEGLEKGQEKGREEGRQEGSYDTLRKVIRNMLQQNQDVSDISKITGISEKEVLEISKSFS